MSKQTTINDCRIIDLQRYTKKYNRTIMVELVKEWANCKL